MNLANQIQPAQAGGIQTPKLTVVDELNSRMNSMNQQLEIQINGLECFLARAGLGDMSAKDNAPQNPPLPAGFLGTDALTSVLQNKLNRIGELLSRVDKIA